MFLPVKEELLYSVKYGPISAGKIKLEFKRDSLSLNHIRCEEETKGLVSRIFKIKDWYESISDSNFVTQRFEKDIREGKYIRHQIVEIENGKAIYQDGDTVEVIEEAKDMINLLYWLRTQEFIAGDTIILPLHADKKNSMIKTCVSNEKVNGELCWLLVPNLKGMKAFGGEGGLLLYYNQAKVPILLKIKFLWGYLEAHLKERKWE